MLRERRAARDTRRRRCRLSSTSSGRADCSGAHGRQHCTRRLLSHHSRCAVATNRIIITRTRTCVRARMNGGTTTIAVQSVSPSWRADCFTTPYHVGLSGVLLVAVVVLLVVSGVVVEVAFADTERIHEVECCARYSTSSGVDRRPSTSLRCGYRPKRAIVSRWLAHDLTTPRKLCRCFLLSRSESARRCSSVRARSTCASSSECSSTTSRNICSTGL